LIHFVVLSIVVSFGRRTRTIRHQRSGRVAAGKSIELRARKEQRSDAAAPPHRAQSSVHHGLADGGVRTKAQIASCSGGREIAVDPAGAGARRAFGRTEGASAA
jgi:hypothetical protein